MNDEELTRIKAFIYLLCCRCISSVSHYREFGLHHSYNQVGQVGYTSTFVIYLPGCISVTRIGVFTSSLIREAVKAWVACFVAV